MPIKHLYASIELADALHQLVLAGHNLQSFGFCFFLFFTFSEGGTDLQLGATPGANCPSHLRSPCPGHGLRILTHCSHSESPAPGPAGPAGLGEVQGDEAVVGAEVLVGALGQLREADVLTATEQAGPPAYGEAFRRSMAALQLDEKLYRTKTEGEGGGGAGKPEFCSVCITFTGSACKLHG